MALVSPGVEVTVVDESQYLPAPTNSIPFVLLATAQNKANPTGTGVASGTTAANAGKLFQVTSQRDLVSLYGNPFFYSTSNGTPIQGYELNEYGLLAAYSALGISNRIYCLRADIDLASLVGQTGRPTGNPDEGTYWLDTLTSTWGINEFNATTGQFVAKNPIVITDPAQLSGNEPVQTLGIPGDYAVNAIPTYDFPNAPSAAQFFYKNSLNSWVAIGSPEWLASWPTVEATNSPSNLNAGDTLTILINGATGPTITVPASPNNNINTLANLINDLGYKFLSATTYNNRLQLYSLQTSDSPNDLGPYSLDIFGTGTILNDLGISAGSYIQPGVAYGVSSQQPLWQAGQSQAHPTGSVWYKIGSANSGFVPAISQWSSVTNNWVPKTVPAFTADFTATANLDSAGGKNIPAGTIYAQYNFDRTINGGYATGPIYFWERLTTGPTVITGNVTFADPAAPVFFNGPYSLTVSVSGPSGSSLTTSNFSLSDGASANDFINAWNGSAISYTTAQLTDAGAIQITHALGGTIIINEFSAFSGESSGLIEDAGFIIGSTVGVKEGPSAVANFQPEQTSTTGVGSGLQINVQTSYGKYYVHPTAFVNSGTGFSVGDTVTYAGTLMGGTSPANDLTIKVVSVNAGAVTGVTQVLGDAVTAYTTQLSNWVEFDMTANEGAPVNAPANNTNWFYSVIDEVDIMVNTADGWTGYRNANYDSNGFPLPSGANTTDPNGPIVSASEPTLQSDGTALVYGDLWIDTSDLENYPIINRWQLVDGAGKWVRIDNADQSSSTGILFADARWATNGTTNPANDPVPSIRSLLTSDYLDVDAPQDTLYPVGMLLFNTRRSGYNVKQYRVNYFNSERFPDTVLPAEKDAWVSASGLQSNGAPYMGRKAQRAMVVQAMRAAIDSNTAVRDEDNAFNLLAAPNYPELQPNMIVLNNDRGQTGFIVGDTPMRLPDDATAIQDWATNAAGATSTGEDGLVTRDTYMGLFYPSGLTNDLNGNLVAVPPSHMVLRTILRNDNIAYPWFAPAGTRRGVIDNAASIGYIDAATGEFQVIKTRIGIRDVLYTNQINPLVFFTGNGLLNYGNKSSFASNSALDRINVARLVAYIRRQLTIAARPFIFEPNDALTRQEISGVIQTLMVDLVAKRGIYDYLVVCDESNNTPARIDRNELWVDVAIEPVKAVEFIYIPVRVFNTGEISGQ